MSKRLNKRMRDQGASVQSIASAHGMTWQHAKQVLHFAETGERPKWKAGTRTGHGATTAQYIQHADVVTRLRDQGKMSFTRIASQLKVAYLIAKHWLTDQRAVDAEPNRQQENQRARPEGPSTAPLQFK